jgi:hypothetical protein
MNSVSGIYATPPLSDAGVVEGPLTQSRQRRTKVVYAFLCLLGLVPLVLHLSPGWQAVGLGLWVPGGGFLAVGGWATLLLPLTWLLFALALFAWFGAGMIVAPPIVWGLAALAAGLMARGPIWPASPYIAAGLVGAFFVRATLKRRATTEKLLRVRAERQAYLPAALTEVESRAGRVEVLEPRRREIDSDAIAAMRYCFDRALQPIGALEGFNKIDQFQTSALRYQLNFLGWTLGQLQSQVTPSFHGYLSLAQRNVIDQYLRRQIWDYWRLENLWGNLSLNADPAAKDNIMLTGYLGINLALYMANTRDLRYAAPGCLEFRLNRHQVFPHDVHSINRSIMTNYKGQDFCLYPCEPNWVYPPCNFVGMTSLVIYDRVFGTSCAPEIIQRFTRQLDTEFTTADGSVVPLRSNVTGFAVPFPFDDQMRAYMGAPFMSPEAARIAWAVGRHDLTEVVGGRLRVRLKGSGFDMGWYKPGHAMLLSTLYRSAQEFGDTELAATVRDTLDELCSPAREDGALFYKNASNTSNLTIAQGRISSKDDWRNTIVNGPPESVFRGPILCDCKYPDVLVAHAFSDGDDLSLVLYPGAAPGPQTLGLERLRPHGAYLIKGGTEQPFRADGAGRTQVTAHIEGRTALQIVPVQ